MDRIPVGARRGAEEADAVRPPAVRPVERRPGIGQDSGSEVTFMPMPVRRIDETRGARCTAGSRCRQGPDREP